jgi:hypothetical protein
MKKVQKDQTVTRVVTERPGLRDHNRFQKMQSSSTIRNQRNSMFIADPHQLKIRIPIKVMRIHNNL